MIDEQHLSWSGIQIVWVVLGLLGALLGIGSMPPMTNRQCWVALGSALVFSSYGPQWVNFIYAHWLPSWVNPTGVTMPEFMLGSIAFICGVGGLFLVPGIIKFWQDPRGLVIAVWQYLTAKRGG